MVSDLKMGGSTGIEVLKTTKTLHPTTAVILMTAKRAGELGLTPRARIVDQCLVGVDPVLISSSITLIIAQRLLRKLCQDCKKPYDPPPGMLERLGVVPDGTQYYQAGGCHRCGETGFSGRMAVHEMLPINNTVREMIVRKASEYEIQAAMRAQGMKFLLEKGMPGFEVTRVDTTIATDAIKLAELTFTDCELPESAVVGEVGAGFKVAMKSLNDGRLSVSCSCVGAAESLLDMATEHVKVRKTFGKLLAERQAIQWMLVESATDIAAGRVRSVVDFGLQTLNIISCPSCSRVENQAFIELAEDVKRMTAYAKDHHVTIAVMGCRVNGPGETDDADLGLWCGPNFVNLKRGTEALGAFPYEEILGRLKHELDTLIAARNA